MVDYIIWPQNFFRAFDQGNHCRKQRRRGRLSCLPTCTMVEVLTLALILSVATAEALLDDDGFEGRSDAVGCEIIPADDDNGNVNGGRRRLRNVFTWPWHAASTAVTSADGSDTSTGR